MRSCLSLGVTRNESVLAAIIVVLVVALIVVVIPKPPTPTVLTLQVTGVSLSPNTIVENEFATLNFTIRNNDPSNQHNVHISFDETDSVLVNVYQGNQSLSTGVGISAGDGTSKVQFLWVRGVQPSKVSTFSFRVTGTLSTSVPTATYSIPVEFVDENLTSFANLTVSLRVNRNYH